VSTPLFAPWELIDQERRRCRLAHVTPLLRRRRSGYRVEYLCPWEDVVLFYEEDGLCTITLEGEENWVSRYTCPLGCNHYRWWLHWRSDLTARNVAYLIQRSDALLISSKLAFLLLPKKYTARWGGTGRRWVVH